MSKNKLLAILAAAVLAVSMAVTAGAAETGYEEGVSASDSIVNTTPAEKVVLVVSFGTSFNQSRDLTIGGIESAVRAAFPGYQVRRAFTSQIIVDKLAQRDKLAVDNVKQAMDRLVKDGVKDVVILPTHVMPGYEYDDVVKEVKTYAGQFRSFTVCKPLLKDNEDYITVAEQVVNETAKYRAEGTAIVLMGHGTEHWANATYDLLQDVFDVTGNKDYIIGTVEAEPTLETVMARLKAQNVKKVVLRPLMVVAGDHANNDMAGDEADSWKSVLTAAGYAVETDITGLGQVKGIQALYVKHVQDAMGAAKTISYEEGVSAADGIVNTSQTEKVLLVVSFGTSFNQSRALTIGGIESALKEAYPDYQVRRAFTSQIIVDKLYERDGLVVDNVGNAMSRLAIDKVKDVIILPTHVMPGYEYDDVVKEVTPYAAQFRSFKVCQPLLITDTDFAAVAEQIVGATEQYRSEGTAVVLMGHGTHHAANATYTKLQGILQDKGYNDYLIGLVEGSEGSVLIEQIQASLKAMNVKKVVLRPLMVVAGDHANNDMAGTEADSWKTILTNDGYEVVTVLEGLGQIAGIQDIYVRHVQETIDADAEPTPVPAETAANVPVSGEIKDGTYAIDVETLNSSMFKIVDCQLTVKDGKMSAVITLSGSGFGKIYMGHFEQASSDTANHHEFTENAEGQHVFTVPVAALDQELKCAGWSINREQWYDYTVVFKSDRIPH